MALLILKNHIHLFLIHIHSFKNNLSVFFLTTIGALHKDKRNNVLIWSVSNASFYPLCRAGQTRCLLKYRYVVSSWKFGFAMNHQALSPHAAQLPLPLPTVTDRLSAAGDGPGHDQILSRGEMSSQQYRLNNKQVEPLCSIHHP